MKNIHTFFVKSVSIIICCSVSTFSFSQGCIAVRSMATANGNAGNTAFMHKGNFQVSANFRHLHSYKHFVGADEQPQRVEQGTEVINDSYNFDFGLTYAITNRLTTTLNLPISFNDRSSLYEHYGNGTPAGSNPRFHTYSDGLNDVRLSLSYWAFNPMTHLRGNVAIGLGIKAPSGNSNVQDNFHKLDNNNVPYLQRKAVDQSIQLGDGGWGYSLEVQGYQTLFKKASLYYNAFYLFSPKELNDATNYSIPDQFGLRLGATYVLSSKLGIAASLGIRAEGLPSVDAIGGSLGSRRPGHIISIEPGIVWNKNKGTFLLTIPIAVVRNRTPTFTATGFKAGDAAFADYFISATYSYRISSHH